MTDNGLEREVKSLNKKRKRKLTWKRIVLILAGITVFWTTYMLILPAITMTNDDTATCGFVDHKHDESCYEIQESVFFSCLENLHKHSEACFDENGSCVCGYADYVIHTHSENCYDKNENLVCTLPEIKEHEHSDSCYETEEKLICELEESEEHQHTEECYESEKTLVCKFSEPKLSEEVTEAVFHEHTDECFENDELVCGQVEILTHTHSETCITKETKEVLICELPEHEHDLGCFPKKPVEEGYFCGLSSHTHSEKCYKEGVLKCNQVEHTHTMLCTSDPQADIETAEKWEASVKKVKLSGNYARDVVEIAKSQIGYTESELNFNVVGEDTKKGYSRYGAWYGNPYDDWNAMFCSFCISYADVSQYPVGSDCDKWISELKKADFFHKTGKYNPKEGDLVFFKVMDESGKFDDETRVGIILDFNADAGEEEAFLKTVEGDYNNKVAEVEYKSNEVKIIGYAEIADEKEAPDNNEDKPSAIADINIAVSFVDDVIVFNASLKDKDIVVTDYNWQWQVSETGVKPWKNLKGGDGLFFKIENTEDNAKKFYRVVGLPKSKEEKQNDVVEYYESSQGEEIVQMKSNKASQVELVGLTFEAKNEDGTVTTTDLLKGKDKQTLTLTAKDDNGSGMLVSAAVSPLLAPLAVGDEPGSIITKPEYAPYITPSGSKQGETSLGEIAGNYWSDPATSQLENNVYFNDRTTDDGKVLTDKSVIYGHDDYNAFSSYDPNTFGVTLSALGQKYSLTEELEIKIPLDVVFVLDVSGSMISSKYGDVTSANIMVESLNNIMHSVLEDNEDNRVGVVCFSGGTTKLLDLGRYTATNNEYFPEGGCTVNTYELTASNSIRYENGGVPNKGTYNKGWYGTYTQAGIANGAQVFLDNNDTSVTRTITKVVDEGTVTATYTAKRHPVFILLSDGEPTYCTEDYNNVLASTNVHGNGNTGFNNNGAQIADNQNNNKGVLGYYTILSAQYYKDQIAAHYNNDAYFYTIGIGINATGINSFANSTAGDDYKRAILNPESDLIAHLATCTSGITQSPDINNQNNNISGKTALTCHMLQQLLTDSYGSTTVTIGSHSQSQATQYGLNAATTANVPIIANNPYRQTGYNYSDGSFFTTNLTVGNLTSAFEEAISFAENFPIYGFILRNNTALRVTDTIGDGMEIKGAPILRVGGENHSPSSVTTNGNIKTYHYSGTFAANDGSDQVIDLTQISAEVTELNGRQTVRLVVADSMLPAYSPNLRNDGTNNFYYEALPVRLIYQVGLTEESEQEVISLDGTGESRTFYTNAWQNNQLSYSTFMPTSKNPYYKDDQYDKSETVKSQNTTGTRQNAWEFVPSSTANNVGKILGNNGKLTFVSEKYTRIPFTIYKVDENSEPITTDFATFELYTDPQLTNLVGEYSTDETGSFTIEDLRTNRTYYLKETKAPIGYELSTAIRSFTLDEDGAVVGMNPQNNIYFTIDEDDNLYVRNDYAEIDIEVEKRWVGELAQGESYPTSIQVQLFADGEAIRSVETLRQSNGWRCTWANLPVISLVDKHVIEYTVEELNIPDGYVLHTETDENGKLIFTNQKQGYTSLSVYKKWQGGSANSVRVELLENGNQTGNYVTLDQSNDWYYLWEHLPVYGEDGEITYSVREIPIEGFSPDVHLWTGNSDPYGMTETETRTPTTNLQNDSRYLLTYRYNNQTYCLASNNNNQLVRLNYNANTAVTDNMLWTVGGNTTKTFTNVAANRRLVISGTNVILGANSNTSTNWTVTTSNNGTITLRARSGGRNYYIALTTINNGNGGTNTNSSSATAITPYLYSYSLVSDDIEKGETHYIIKNTQEPTAPSISLSFNKVSGEDTTVTLSGAEFSIYRETAMPSDTLIPSTSDRYGVLVTSWETDGQPHTISFNQNGVYYIVETRAPDGYEPLTQPIVFDVTSSSGTRTAHIVRHPSLESGTAFTAMNIENPSRIYPKMPSTGGFGTAWIYMLGVAMMTTAVYMFLRRSKRKTA